MYAKKEKNEKVVTNGRKGLMGADSLEVQLCTMVVGTENNSHSERIHGKRIHGTDRARLPMLSLFTASLSFQLPSLSYQYQSQASTSVIRCSATVSATIPPVVSATIPPVEMADTAHPLIQRANEILYSESGFYSPYNETAFSEDFVFRGPYIGPLNKQDYLSTMDTFKIHEAIPDISPNAFGFSIDPKDPNRVWFMVRNSGTATGELGLDRDGKLRVPGKGAVLDGCPETFSIIFDADRKVKYLSVGYVADRFEGNTNGKGAAVGIFHVIGLPFPSPGPLLKFAQWLGTEVADLGARSYSTENVPAWWKSEERASEGYL